MNEPDEWSCQQGGKVDVVVVVVSAWGGRERKDVSNSESSECCDGRYPQPKVISLRLWPDQHIQYTHRSLVTATPSRSTVNSQPHDRQQPASRMTVSSQPPNHRQQPATKPPSAASHQTTVSSQPPNHRQHITHLRQWTINNITNSYTV
ncbi:hypothetical protein Hamer_G022912 [Homarus americanus]|uniref:Uncharacterized protein n=1 Tax=Homarus americanus TaxID=6706 RepID=A0A8J5N6T7_HOMAM|nr:hypothetical protein Hamer_G022912 [Homarus americanus]